MKKILSLMMVGLLCVMGSSRVVAMTEFDHSSVVNATDKKIRVTIVTNENTQEADVATLMPGAVWEYGEKRLRRVIVQIYRGSSGNEFITTLEKNFGNKFGLSVVREFDTPSGYDIAGPGYGNEFTGALYLVNATPYTITYHVGYNACSSREGTLSPFGRNLVRLEMGLCKTDNVHGWYFEGSTKKWVIKNSTAYSSGVFVYRETYPGSNVIEVKRFLLGPYAVWGL